MNVVYDCYHLICTQDLENFISNNTRLSSRVITHLVYISILIEKYYTNKMYYFFGKMKIWKIWGFKKTRITTQQLSVWFFFIEKYCTNNICYTILRKKGIWKNGYANRLGMKYMTIKIKFVISGIYRTQAHNSKTDNKIHQRVQFVYIYINLLIILI